MNICTPVFAVKTYERPLIFLAGPTLREGNPTPWRLDAIKIFEERGFQGTLAVPEPYCGNYERQITWEAHHLKKSDCILFWIPRNMLTLPGLTTNVEFGEWMKSGKVVLGFPPEAEHVRYLAYKADENGIPVAGFLEDAIKLTTSIARWSKR